MTERSWKSWERRSARDHGTERTPVSGRQSDAGGLDWESAVFCAQVKLGYRQPGYLTRWLGEIVQHARTRGKIGFVLWKEKYKPDAEALVLRYDDWRDLHGNAAEPGAGTLK